MTRAEAAAVLCRMSDAVEKDRQNKPMDVSAQVLELVNQERAREGLSPLALDEKLTESALIRAGELKINFSHTRPDGSPCGTALDETGAYDGASRSKTLPSFMATPKRWSTPGWTRRAIAAIFWTPVLPTWLPPGAETFGPRCLSAAIERRKRERRLQGFCSAVASCFLSRFRL